MSGRTLVEISGLRVDYRSGGTFLSRGRTVNVLDGIDLELVEGETLGVVGESGCGKSTLGNSLLRLVPITSGRVVFDGRDLATIEVGALRALRRDIQMVFQNPFSSLNPRMRVLDLVAEPLRTHTTLRRAALESKVAELLREVGLGEDFVARFPHQLSGGQAQRVVIARALALGPRLLVLDEPTAALDVSVQAQIVNLLARLQRDHQLTYLFISHDLGVVKRVSDRIAVMYLGRIVELGPADRIFESPQHPYTRALLASTPEPDPERRRERIRIAGAIPDPASPPAGCRFHTRCPFASGACRTEVPPVVATGAGGWAACHLLPSGGAPEN